MGNNPPSVSRLSVLLGFILLAMGVAKIVMGFVYSHDCELQRTIPIFLTVGGITSGSIGFLFFLAVGFYEKKKSITCSSFISSIIVCIFRIIWLVMGYTYVFPRGKTINVPQCNPGDMNCVTCNSVLLDFAIAIVVIDVVLLAPIVVAIVCVASVEKLNNNLQRNQIWT